MQSKAPECSGSTSSYASACSARPAMPRIIEHEGSFGVMHGSLVRQCALGLEGVNNSPEGQLGYWVSEDNDETADKASTSGSLKAGSANSFNRRALGLEGAHRNFGATPSRVAGPALLRVIRQWIVPRDAITKFCCPLHAQLDVTSPPLLFRTGWVPWMGFLGAIGSDMVDLFFFCLNRF